MASQWHRIARLHAFTFIQAYHGRSQAFRGSSTSGASTSSLHMHLSAHGTGLSTSSWRHAAEAFWAPASFTAEADTGSTHSRSCGVDCTMPVALMCLML